MPAAGRLEHLDRGLDLHQCRNEIGLDGGLVGPQLARSERRALADAGVDDDAVDAAEFVGELGEHLGHLLVVVDVERSDRDRDAGMALEQFGLQLVEPVDAAGAQRQVTALGGELAGHARAQARAAPVIRIFCRVIGTDYSRRPSPSLRLWAHRSCPAGPI